MENKLMKFGCLCALLMAALLFGKMPVMAEEAEILEWTNETTGYRVILEDGADLLTPEQETEVIEEMKKVAEYGNIALKTASRNGISASSYASVSYHKYFEKQTGILCLMDLEHKEVVIHTEGKLSQMVDKSENAFLTKMLAANNSKKKYADGMIVLSNRVYKLMDDQKKFLPVRILCSAFLAIVIALLLNFIWLTNSAKAIKTYDDELLDNTLNYHDHTYPTVDKMVDYGENKARNSRYFS